MSNFPRIPIQLLRPPPLDEAFYPAALVQREFAREIQRSKKGVPVVLGLERADGSISRYETQVFSPDHPWAVNNASFVERLAKFLLWQKGGCTLYVGGPGDIAAYLQQYYSPAGEGAFDYHFMGEDVYLQTFRVVACPPEEVPAEREVEQALGRHLNGCRIGFDLGASDIKVSAVMDGEAVFTQEIEWDPRSQADLEYHHSHILAALRTAAGKLPRVDAIGGSSAGVIIANRPRVASLFRGIPKERYAAVRNLFLRIGEEMGAPLEIINDGEVSALAGSMALGSNAVLGIAMGSSEASGYITPRGNITNWLNEMAFAPIDYNPQAPVDEWSGDRGVGSMYLSQQCVFRLAPRVGLQLSDELSAVQKLKSVQDRLESGHPGARQIWETMGCYLGYAIAHYANFYTLEHVLILGRCTSGSGGPLMLEHARQVLQAEFPELAEQVTIHLPDEMSRRLGQSIVAASLPEVR